MKNILREIFNLSDFVNYNHLTREEILMLACGRIVQAKEAGEGEHIRVDELDCSKDFRRVTSTKTVQEVLAMIPISRQIHCAERDNELCVNVKENDIEYFLWIGRNTYYDKK